MHIWNIGTTSILVFLCALIHLEPNLHDYSQKLKLILILKMIVDFFFI